MPIAINHTKKYIIEYFDDTRRNVLDATRACKRTLGLIIPDRQFDYFGHYKVILYLILSKALDFS